MHIVVPDESVPDPDVHQLPSDQCLTSRRHLRRGAASGAAKLKVVLTNLLRDESWNTESRYLDVDHDGKWSKGASELLGSKRGVWAYLSSLFIAV